ncbi:uroporphyrinogen decarboxylase family protein [Thermodesulfobacteriota bacterium]
MAKTAEEILEERKQRIADAVQLKKPDRVPFSPFFSFFPAKYSGISCEEYMYDYDKMYESCKKATLDFEPDQYLNPFPLFALGSIMEMLDFKQLKWPGHGVTADRTYQFVEGEYMTADEYDAYLSDSTDYMLRTYLPRVCGSLDPLKMLPNIPAQYYLRIPRSVAVFGIPEVAGMLEMLLKAGAEGQKMMGKAMAFGAEMTQLGFPGMFGGTAYAPFDYFGDNFRGTKGMMLDMYRQPDNVIKATEKIMPILAASAIADAKRIGVPYIFIPLHKGLDGFMSLEQFEKFYWPTLRELMMSFIKEDLVPCPLWEGKCDSRLEIIKDISPGKAIYHFEQTDLFRAKEVLGDRVCIRGGVPVSVLCTGTPEDVEQHCKNIIEGVGRDGGFIMDGPIGVPDETKPENLKAFEETTKKFGIY